MMTSAKKSFRAVLEPLRNGLGWVIARIPFDVAKAWPERRRLRVRGEIEGFQFRSSLFAASNGEGHFLLVNKKMQKAAGAAVGAQVRIILEPDLEEREAIIPPELAQALKGERQLRKWFDGLSPYYRKTLGAIVSEAKTPASREKRAEQMAETLLQAMEGEADLPPILHAAFLRQPLARAGWNAMTPAQRRGHLLGIFYYKGVESRERRAAKAVEEALRLARKHSRTAD
jgi:uncharacterized protein YdeI (YjbR/CyaY-like superfamily)